MSKFLVLPALLIFVLSCDKPKEQPENAIDSSHPEAISLMGDTLYRPTLPESVMLDYKKKLEDTRLMYKADPDAVINIIWYGRRLAYMGRFTNAIEIYSRGMALHPDSYQILRHRGHRYITIRQFDRAIADLTRATVLATGSELEVEPDGIPNKLNKPLTTTQWNIYYHLGLAHYLNGDYEMAVEAFKPCLALADSPDLKVAATDWLYMAYQRLGKNEEAKNIINEISPQWEMVENESYFKRIMMYQGQISPEELMAVNEENESLTLATQGYGLGNYYLNKGDTTLALETFSQVLNTGNWPAFGYIAAEADLSRLSKNKD